MRNPLRVIGWLVDEADRDRLLARIPPAYPHVIAHHVTLRRPRGKDDAAPPADSAEVVGVADDGEGVQALVVRLNGTTDRPDGSTYHITWSLAPGRDAKESNDVIAERGWTPLPEPLPVRLTPGDVN